MDAKFEHDLGSMCFDSPYGNLQQLGNFFIRLSLSQKTNNFSLARSDSCGFHAPYLVLASWFENSFQHDFGYFRRNETLTRDNGFHGFGKITREIGFQKV